MEGLEKFKEAFEAYSDNYQYQRMIIKGKNGIKQPENSLLVYNTTNIAKIVKIAKFNYPNTHQH